MKVTRVMLSRRIMVTAKIVRIVIRIIGRKSIG